MRVLKSLATIAILSLPALACQNITNDTLDKSTLYVFNPGDTLVYYSNSASDTFLVTENRERTINSDKTHNIETLQVSTTQIKANNDSSSFGFSIYRVGMSSTNLDFRNIDFTITGTASFNNTLKTGHTTISNVFILNRGTDNSTSSSDISILYYTHKYGIVGYELVTGERMILGEQYLGNR
ncbi:MAG TPA: hypothetical protein VMW01_11070 [Williamwhitmania sp.]|nr:hypothetical protein [Williamwhitmania sp.]